MWQTERQTPIKMLIVYFRNFSLKHEGQEYIEYKIQFTLFISVLEYGEYCNFFRKKYWSFLTDVERISP